MSGEIRSDMSCVPYQRKWLYLLLTIPFLSLLISVFIYLWTFSFILPIVFLLFYLAMCCFQAYCCAYQDCPYVGEFCPAVIGIFPANLITGSLYSGKEIVKSKKTFDLHATLAIVGWLGLVGFPLNWIAKLDPSLAVGYVISHMVYAVVFGLTICPVCAIRDTCPGGKFHKFVSRLRARK